MGHESRIEPWSPHLTAFCFAGFGTDRLRSEEVMKTAGRENPNRWGNASSKPSTSRGSSEQILLNHVGCEARKSPAVAGVFFLDFPFYRTYRDLAAKSDDKLRLADDPDASSSWLETDAGAL